MQSTVVIETGHVLHKTKMLITNNMKYEIIWPSTQISLPHLEPWHLLGANLNQVEDSYVEYMNKSAGWLRVAVSI